MRRIVCGLVFSIFTTLYAFADGTGGNGVDKYYLSFPAIGLNTGATSLLQAPNLDDHALSQTAAQTIDTTKTNLILIPSGQSNNVDVAPSAYSPINASSIFQLNIYTGKIYPAVDPLLGTNINTTVPLGVGHPTLREADAIITAGYFQRVYIVPNGIAGTSVANWVTSGEAQLFPVTVSRLIQKGILCGTTNITCVIVWGQGEADNELGTSQASYTNSFNTLVTNVATAGFVGHWYVAKQTYFAGTTSAPVQAAQLAVVNSTTVFAGPNADALSGSVCGPSVNAACRQTDNVHWSDNGSFSYAAAWVTALHAGGF
jgi:Carbohydrate esterase, sialic acid-specific acetylesterase